VRSTGPGPLHKPVMVRQVLQGLKAGQGRRFIDCTIGEGGHARAILEAACSEARLLGIDVDPEMMGPAMKRLSSQGDRVTVVPGSYVDVVTLAQQAGFFPADGVLMDLGVSSLHLEIADRGFSFDRDGPLDMRFDRSQWIDADKIVNRYPEQRLAQMIRDFGEERGARRIARSIVSNRPITTTAELARTVAGALKGTARTRIHPATRTFQALRIAVNRELENVERGLSEAIGSLSPGGRLVVIAYHSLEDRPVKAAMRMESSDCLCPLEVMTCVCGHKPRVRLVNRRVLRPTKEEIAENPRSRSARIRIAERLATC
jgi:16S rRNA (cytosine1402-N4)-methyltransferase